MLPSLPGIHDPVAIRAAAGALAESQGLRPRDVARRLGISEAELLAAGVGAPGAQRVHRLADDLAGVLGGIPRLGPVMALTRNEAAVIETVGPYGEVRFNGSVGGVFDRPIDLRFFLDHWRHGFAVEQDVSDGPVRRSLQFFDGRGHALHKVYLRPDSDLVAFRTLLERHRHPVQVPHIEVAEEATAALPGEAAGDAAALRERWRSLGDVHEFQQVLGELRLGREQAFRMAGSDLARRVEDVALRRVTTTVARAELPVMLFVPNAGCIQIRTGVLRILKAAGVWWNVLDPGFNLHLREDLVASSWVVGKPSRDGWITSLELFDATGRLLLMMFGERVRGRPECPQWRGILQDLVERGEDP